MSWVGIDLGGTKIYAVVFDGDRVLAEAKAKTPTQGGPLAVVDAMAAVVRDLGPVEDLTGIGVGAPGVIDPSDEGTVQQAPNLAGWMEPFRDFGMTAVSNQGVGSTDHVSFDEVGLPGFQFLQDRVPGTGGHTNLDFYDTIQGDDLMRNAVVMASYAWHAANTDERMPRKVRR